MLVFQYVSYLKWLDIRKLWNGRYAASGSRIAMSHGRISANLSNKREPTDFRCIASILPLN